MTDGLKPKHRAAIVAALAAHEKVERAVLFGSRAMQTHSASSDVDIALFGEGLTWTDLAELSAAMDEVPMAQSVDLVLHRSIDNPALLKHIREHGVEWYRRCGGCNGTREIEGEHVVLVEGKEVERHKWREVKLGEVIEINDATYSPKEGWPFINYLDTGNITENCISEIQHLISGTDKIPSRARRKVERGDIVYSIVRPNQRHFGLIKDVPDNFLASTGFAVIRGKNDVAHTDYIYWFLAQDHIVKYLHSIAENNTSAYPSIRPIDLEVLVLTLPPLPEQRAIAHVLGTLDDKIELNRRMNETLEAMARALFKDWFVDFGPVRAKMEGRGTGLPEDVADLFPDRLVDSELGEIPEGWEAGTLGSLIDLNPKRALRKGEIAPYLDMANMPTTGHVPDKWFERPFGSGMRFTNGDTLLARITPCLENGKTAYIDFLPRDSIGWGSTEFVVMRPRPPLPNEFAYCLARSAGFREYAIHNMTGTSGRQRVPATALSNFPLAAPIKDIAEYFGELVGPLFAQSSANAETSRTLMSLRDTLLPKLISGEIRLREAGKWFEEVV